MNPISREQSPREAINIVLDPFQTLFSGLGQDVFITWSTSARIEWGEIKKRLCKTEKICLVLLGDSIISA